MPGRLVGIARRDARRAPMEMIETGEISPQFGLDGDHKGARFPRRQITMMTREAWAAALNALELPSDALPWTVRRANLLVEGLELPRAKGGQVAIGLVHLEVTGQTVPCRRMDEAQLARSIHQHVARHGGKSFEGPEAGCNPMLSIG